MLSLVSPVIIVGLVLLPMSLLILLVGVWLYLRTRGFISTAGQATARVVALQMDEAGEVYYPIFEFTTADGKMLRIKGSTGSNPPRHKVGDVVSLLYDPRRPEDARERKFLDLWALPSMAIGLGGLCTTILVLFLLSQR